MEKIRIYYDKRGNTLNVWFADPKREYISEETGNEVILTKDRRGKVIGFEKLNFLPKAAISAIHRLPVEAKVA